VCRRVKKCGSHDACEGANFCSPVRELKCDLLASLRIWLAVCYFNALGITSTGILFYTSKSTVASIF
jgi:hypothetical protein